MYSDFYNELYTQSNNNEIYVKNDQIYDNETRSTVPIQKEYETLPVSLNTQLNTTCRCGADENYKTPLIASKFSNTQQSDQMDVNSTSIMGQQQNSSKFTLHLSLTITEIIEILILIMIVVLIAITIRTRSRVVLITPTQPTTTTPP